MGTPYERVASDIQHVHDMLEGQRENLGEEPFQRAVNGQASNILTRLRNMPRISSEDAMALQGMILRGPWTAEQKGEMCEMLTARPSSAPSGAHQLVEHFSQYLTQSDVMVLSDPMKSHLCKAKVISDRMISVGMVRPYEKSYRPILKAAMAGGWKLQTHEQLTWLEAIKNQLRTHTRNNALPEPYLDVFPANPLELPPALRACFENEPSGNVCMTATNQTKVDLRRSSRSQRPHLMQGSQAAMAMVPYQAPSGVPAGSSGGANAGFSGGANAGFNGGMNSGFMMDPGNMMQMMAAFGGMMQQMMGFGKGKGNDCDVYMTGGKTSTLDTGGKTPTLDAGDALMNDLENDSPNVQEQARVVEDALGDRSKSNLEDRSKSQPLVGILKRPGTKTAMKAVKKNETGTTKKTRPPCPAKAGMGTVMYLGGKIQNPPNGKELRVFRRLKDKSDLKVKVIPGKLQQAWDRACEIIETAEKMEK